MDVFEMDLLARQRAERLLDEAERERLAATATKGRDHDGRRRRFGIDLFAHRTRTAPAP
jgi:hypothetical protein